MAEAAQKLNEIIDDIAESVWLEGGTDDPLLNLVLEARKNSES